MFVMLNIMPTRKHLRRHERPYGCTYQRCHKRFGSKNDWKRHESTQHFAIEMWMCEVQDVGDPSSCKKVFYRRGLIDKHLKQDHGMVNQSEVDSKIMDYQTGRGCEARFWCGFCEGVIDTKLKGLRAWTARIDHIDDHFVGRKSPKKTISEWKQIDQDLPDVGFDWSPDSPNRSPHSSPEPGEDGAGDSGLGTVGGAAEAAAATSVGKKRKVNGLIEDDEHQIKRLHMDNWACVRFPFSHLTSLVLSFLIAAY